jgi:hypothetical protein
MFGELVMPHTFIREERGSNIDVITGIRGLPRSLHTNVRLIHWNTSPSRSSFNHDLWSSFHFIRRCIIYLVDKNQFHETMSSLRRRESLTIPIHSSIIMPLDSILSQRNPVHTLTHYFKIQFNIILPYTPRSPKLRAIFLWGFQLKFCINFTYTPCILHSFHFTLLHHNIIWWRVQIMEILPTDISPHFCYFLSVRSIFSSVLRSQFQSMFFP